LSRAVTNPLKMKNGLNIIDNFDVEEKLNFENLLLINTLSDEDIPMLSL